MAKIRLFHPEESYTKIGTNSASFANGDAVSVTSGFAVKSTAGKRIIGIANGTKTFASDNQTVALDTINYTRVEPNDSLAEMVTSATITTADVGKYYDLVTSTHLVDVATALVSESGMVVNTSDGGAATDPVIIRQVRLEKVLTTTSGVFSFV